MTVGQSESDGDEPDGSAPVPDRAKTVLVPTANPETAASLLVLASSLADPEGGKVVALAVVTDDTSAEERSGALEDLEDLVAATGWTEGATFEMATVRRRR